MEDSLKNVLNKKNKLNYEINFSYRWSRVYRFKFSRIFDGNIYPDFKIVVVDSLTYAGDLENLNAVKDSKNFTFVHGSIFAIED